MVGGKVAKEKNIVLMGLRSVSESPEGSEK